MLKNIIVLFIFFWSFLLFFSSGIVESQDGLQYLTVARQIYYHHTFAMPAAKYPLDNIHMNVTKSIDGVEYAPTGLGYSLAYLPAVMVEDAFNRLAGVQPTENFPLDNDWPIMLFGSMTNAFFGALIIVTFYLVLKTYDFTNRLAFLLASVLFASSNLFVYTKHSFAHLMFISFMLLCFYFLRLYTLKPNIKHIIFAALCYGIVMLSYNPTYLLPLPALSVYYLSSITRHKKTLSRTFTLLTRDVLVAITAIIPFFAIYSWFNWVRFGGPTSTGYGAGGIAPPPIPQAFVFFEGLWGLLFSPGKSIFLFTPILIVLILFWFKIKRKYFVEVVTAGTMFIVYLVFTASLVGGPDFFPWHGEASFGPRYMLPVLPLALLLVVFIYQELTQKQKTWFFWPLIVLGIGVQAVGTLIPYQVRFSGFDYQYEINGHRITSDVYANFLPRFSPLYTMGKWFARKVLAFPNYYLIPPSVQTIDGVHGILNTSSGDWKQIEPVSALKIYPPADAVSLTLSFRNHVSTQSAEILNYPLHIKAYQEDRSIGEVSVNPAETGEIIIAPNSLESRIPLVLSQSYEGTTSAKSTTQTPFLVGISSEEKPVQLESYHSPYVSKVSEKLFGQKYYYWGKENVNLWALWNMRSINYVHTFDLWWLKPFHYWDLPKNFYLLLFLGNATMFIVAGYLVKKRLITQGKNRGK